MQPEAAAPRARSAVARSAPCTCRWIVVTLPFAGAAAVLAVLVAAAPAARAKALLFLCAGAINHATGTNSMRALGVAAIAGLPPLAGFFRKEAILRRDRAHRGRG